MVTKAEYNSAKRIAKVMECYLQLCDKHQGNTDIWIFNRFIKDEFNISIATFKRYKTVNYRKIINDYENQSNNT